MSQPFESPELNLTSNRWTVAHTEEIKKKPNALSLWQTQCLSMQVLKEIQQPLEQSLPDDVLVTASAILAPKSGLSDKARYSSCTRTLLQKLDTAQLWAVSSYVAAS